MTWRMMWLAFGLCVTVYAVVDDWPWYWIALNVAIDLWNIAGLIEAASRGDR